MPATLIWLDFYIRRTVIISGNFVSRLGNGGVLLAITAFAAALHRHMKTFSRSIQFCGSLIGYWGFLQYERALCANPASPVLR